jgi:hypothetical protein
MQLAGAPTYPDAEAARFPRPVDLLRYEVVFIRTEVELDRQTADFMCMPIDLRRRQVDRACLTIDVHQS